MEDPLKRRRKRRWGYMDDFEKNVAGEWIYTGKVIGWVADRKETLRRYWVITIIACAACLAAGLLPSVGMDSLSFVLMTYVLGLVGCATVIWAVGRLAAGGDPIREYQFKGSVGKLMPRIIGTLICSGLSLILEIINLFLPAFAGVIPLAILYILLEGIIFTAMIFLLRLTRSLEWDR